MPFLPPTPDEQLTFLAKLQRIFAEGDFTATYKFALLIPLADLAVELGTDTGNELLLTNRQIAQSFISQYWKQALPYGTGRSGCETGVLIQNNGVQAAVISAISNFRDLTNSKSLSAAVSHPDFKQLVTSIAATVSAQPLTYLQNFGGATDEFIYERMRPGVIRLKPGITYCLRRFYPLIQQLARNHLVSHIKGNRRNLAILGETDDLEEFLFETSRQSLEVIRKGLLKLDGAKCFYCGQNLTTADVDHFIPFSQYPRDLSHNFVLAHPSCNRSKSDTLAALEHLERWLARIDKCADAIAEIGSRAGFVSDSLVIHKVGSWAYANSAQANGHAWISANNYTPIDSNYTECFRIAN